MEKDAWKQYEERVNGGTFYQAEADDNLHIFFKEEPFLLDIPHFHESVELLYVTSGSIAGAARRTGYSDNAARKWIRSGKYDDFIRETREGVH
ncbi:MAG: hypothetical protein MJ072_07185, partial [Clostridia bacterium]|nr:hypothetical protein [Clostridia bacterium]